MSNLYNLLKTIIEKLNATVKSINGKTGDVTLNASNVGADASGTAESKVSTHNTSTDAHSDIRLLISDLTDSINALADSDDATLDQLSEIVAYIKSNRDLISYVTTSKVNMEDIIDNLTTNVANKPLSAAQGVALKELIDAISIPEVDETLSESGKSADAAVVGQKFSSLSEEMLTDAELSSAVDNALSQAKESGEFDGADGKSAYQYAQDGGYTGTEEAFAEKLAKEPLIGTTDELTPTQVYNAVSAGIPVKVQYTDSTYGLLSFTAFNVAESLNLIVSPPAVYYNGAYILIQLAGDKSEDTWGILFTTLAQEADIPSALPNPNALTFTGAVTGIYDGSAPLSVEIPSTVTDAHINSLIDTKLGVIENGAY